MAELKGTRELTNALLKLPAAVEAKALRKSAISGARVVKAAIVALAPVAAADVKRRGGVTTVGTLKRAVVLKFAKEKSGLGKSTYVVAIRHGKREQKSNRDAFYWLWVEQGHAVRRPAKGKVVGQAAPHPFFVPAYRQVAEQARQKMKSTLETEVTKLIKGA